MVPKNSAEHSPSKGVRFTGGASFLKEVNVAPEPSNENPSGVGLWQGHRTAKAVYAQLVDNTSGPVLSNIATPIPVTLDGRTHTVTMNVEDIADTAEPGD